MLVNGGLRLPKAMGYASASRGLGQVSVIAIQLATCCNNAASKAIYNAPAHAALSKVPTGTMVRNLKAARLAADIADVPLIILARTDANAAKLITNDFDDNDKPFLTGKRSPEGFFYVKEGIEQAISRGLAYAPYADLIWCETATPNLEEAKKLSLIHI